MLVVKEALVNLDPNHDLTQTDTIPQFSHSIAMSPPHSTSILFKASLSNSKSSPVYIFFLETVIVQ